MPVALRRVSTDSSASSRNHDPSVAPSIRCSRDSSFIEDALYPGDRIGPGLLLRGEPVAELALHPTPPRRPSASHSPAPVFEVVRKLGAGSYAVVYLVREVLENSHHRPREYAIKCLSRSGNDPEGLEAQLLEARIHQALPQHPNVATLYRTLHTDSYLLLLLEYVPGEDLFYFLEQARDHDELRTPPDALSATPPTPSLLASLHPDQLLSNRRLRLVASMFAQMCEAVAHCHRAGVYHRDIKPENFIVTDGHTLSAAGEYERRVVVKLTDFGLATWDNESSDVDVGSAPYMSYECRNNIAPTYETAPADVWSLGIVLINMLYHHNPWADTSQGACPSFTYYLQNPVAFFMQRFPGMTPAVAQFFAQRVFCLLDPTGAKPPRIDAYEFGLWAQELPRHLGARERRMPHIAFQQMSSSSSAPRTSISSNDGPTPHAHRLPFERESMDSDRAAYRDKAPPPLSSLPPVRQPVFASHDHGDSDLDPDSDEEEYLEDGTKSRSASRRRKRAARGKGSTPTTASASPLVQTPRESAHDRDSLDQLATAMQSRARELSKLSLANRTPAEAIVIQHMLSEAATTPAPPAPVAALRKKKSSKWGDIFRRDSASDQEFVSDAKEELAGLPSPVDDHEPHPLASITSLGSSNKARSIAGSAISASTAATDPGLPTARAQVVRTLIMGLAPPVATAPTEESRGRKKSNESGNRPRTPNSQATNDKKWRAKSTDRMGSGSPSRIHHSHLSPDSPSAPYGQPFYNAPPVPQLPAEYRDQAGSIRQVPGGAAPSIRSVATTSTSASSNWRSGLSSSASSRYEPSMRSVSTAATSVSGASVSSNWRTEAGAVKGKGNNPPLPKNVKQMDGIPWVLDELPRSQFAKPKDHGFKPPPTPGGKSGKPALMPLDTISERAAAAAAAGFDDGGAMQTKTPRSAKRFFNWRKGGN